MAVTLFTRTLNQILGSKLLFLYQHPQILTLDVKIITFPTLHIPIAGNTV